MGKTPAQNNGFQCNYVVDFLLTNGSLCDKMIKYIKLVNLSTAVYATDEKELDGQFLHLHKELFADYDCSKCRNCYKMYRGSIPTEDIDRNAQFLQITPEQFIDTYLEKEEYGINYQTKHKPCDFCRRMETVNWEMVSQIVVRSIRILISQKDYQVC